MPRIAGYSDDDYDTWSLRHEDDDAVADEVDEGPSPEDLARFNHEDDLCEECGATIHSDLDLCPHCGAFQIRDDSRPVRGGWSPFARNPKLIAIVALAVAAAWIWMFLG